MKFVLTSNGFENKRIGEKFIELLRVKKENAKVSFIPTAAINDDAKAMLPKCLEELVKSGINPEYCHVSCDRKLTKEEITSFDALYFAGGSPQYLYKKICTIGYDKNIKTALTSGAVYVGAIKVKNFQALIVQNSIIELLE